MKEEFEPAQYYSESQWWRARTRFPRAREYPARFARSVRIVVLPSLQLLPLTKAALDIAHGISREMSFYKFFAPPASTSGLELSPRRSDLSRHGSDLRSSCKSSCDDRSAPAEVPLQVPPHWMQVAAQDLRTRYPFDRFEIVTRITKTSTPAQLVFCICCVDCPGKVRAEAYYRVTMMHPYNFAALYSRTREYPQQLRDSLQEPPASSQSDREDGPEPSCQTLGLFHHMYEERSARAPPSRNNLGL